MLRNKIIKTTIRHSLSHTTKAELKHPVSLTTEVDTLRSHSYCQAVPWRCPGASAEIVPARLVQMPEEGTQYSMKVYWC